MNNLNNHINSDKIKWVITGIALLLLIVMVVGIGLQVFGEGNLQPSNWFADKEEGKTETTGENKDSGKELNASGFQVSEIVTDAVLALRSTPIALADYEHYGVAEAAESATTITATITPENATNKNLNWSLAWNDPSSAFASGKSVTDYLNIASYNGLSVNIECLKPFGEQIVLTAVSEDNNSAKATCTFDYIKRLTGLTLSLSGDNVSFFPSGSQGPDTYRVDMDSDVTLSYTAIYTDGTLQGNINFKTSTTKLSTALFNAVNIESSNVHCVDSTTVFINVNLNSGNEVSMHIGTPDNFVSFIGDAGSYRSRYQNSWYNFLNDNQNAQHATLSIPYQYAYGGGYAVKNGTATVKLAFRSESIALAVESISFDNTSVIL